MRSRLLPTLSGAMTGTFFVIECKLHRADQRAATLWRSLARRSSLLADAARHGRRMLCNSRIRPTEPLQQLAAMVRHTLDFELPYAVHGSTAPRRVSVKRR
jgi:hypothetical protein